MEGGQEGIYREGGREGQDRYKVGRKQMGSSLRRNEEKRSNRERGKN